MKIQIGECWKTYNKIAKRVLQPQSMSPPLIMEMQIDPTVIVKMPEANCLLKSSGRARQLSYRYNASRERQSNVIISNPTPNLSPKSTALPHP